MEIVERDTDTIKPYERNPRKNDEAVDLVANSIKEFGFKVPIVIDSNGIIVAGHTRYKAAKKLGLTKIPCIIASDLTKNQIKAYRLADNKVGEIAQWDFNVLAVELDDMFDFDMSDFGFVEDSIAVDGFGEEFSLPDGDKSDICQMSFTLHQQQKELIEYAMETVKDDIEETFGNGNRNGNALYEVVRQWAGQRK